MRKKILTALVAVFLVTSSAYAQLPLSVGVKAGANLSNVSLSNNDDDGDFKAKLGFKVGVDAKMKLPISGLFVQSGLEFTTKGYKFEEKYDDAKYEVNSNAMYLQLPVMAGYSIDAAGLGINFMVGPYFAYGIGGKTKYKERDYDFPEYNFDSKENTFGKDAYKKFDMGLTGAVGVEVSKFYVNLGYELGLSNIAHTDDSDVKAKNRNAFLTVGYKIF